MLKIKSANEDLLKLKTENDQNISFMWSFKTIQKPAAVFQIRDILRKKEDILFKTSKIFKEQRSSKESVSQEPRLVFKPYKTECLSSEKSSFRNSIMVKNSIPRTDTNIKIVDDLKSLNFKLDPIKPSTSINSKRFKLRKKTLNSSEDISIYEKYEKID